MLELTRVTRLDDPSELWAYLDGETVLFYTDGTRHKPYLTAQVSDLYIDISKEDILRVRYDKAVCFGIHLAAGDIEKLRHKVAVMNGTLQLDLTRSRCSTLGQ